MIDRNKVEQAVRLLLEGMGYGGCGGGGNHRGGGHMGMGHW